MDRRERGFTLVELLVVVAIMGLIASVIAATFVVIIRSSPAAEDRNDDSRTLLGLANYLPLDVSSAQVDPGTTNGIVIPSLDLTPPTACGVGEEVLALHWSDAGSGAAFIASYRYVDESGYRIIRYACRDGVSIGKVKLTSALPSPPTPITVNAITGDPDKNPATTPNNVRIGVQFRVTTQAGNTQAIDAVTDNVKSILTPIVATSSTSSTIAPPANTPPEAQDKSLDAWNTQVVIINLPVVDADGDVLLTTATMPNSNWTYAMAGSGRVMYLTPDPAATIGVEYSIPYTVNDNRGGTDAANLYVRIVDSSASTTTSTTSTTSTTTTSTTTTTTVPCTVSSASISESPISNGVHDNVGPLKKNFTVTITKSGSCVNLVLSFVPDANTNTRVDVSFNDGTQVSISKADFHWSDGSHVLEVRPGASGSALNSVTLVVT